MTPSPSAPPVDLLRPVASLKPAAPDKVRETALAFEASFISALLQPVFAALPTDGPFGGGAGEETFRSFLVDAVAKQTVKAGGLGLADRVQAEMLKLQEGVR